MNDSGDFLLTFDSTHHAMRAESLLEAAGLAIMIIPTPRQLTASCGLAIVHAAGDRESVERVLRGSTISVSGRYRIEADAQGAKHYVSTD